MPVYFDTGQSLGSACHTGDWISLASVRESNRLMGDECSRERGLKDSNLLKYFCFERRDNEHWKRDLKLGASEAYASGQTELSAFYSQWRRHNILLLLSLSRFNPWKLANQPWLKKALLSWDVTYRHRMTPDQLFLFVGTLASDASCLNVARWQIWRMNLERELTGTGTKISQRDWH